MADSAVRIITFERDQATGARSVLDIREFDSPSGATPRTWTDLSRENDRRALILDLMRQVDQLVAGDIDEITLVLGAKA